MTLATPLWPWQQSDWSRLNAYITQQRLPQALLISGKKGVGKRHLAEQFGYALLCANPKDDGLACGRCPACLLSNAGNHPDFFTLAPDEPGKAITVDSIRALIAKLTLKPQFERHRVVIVEPADAMNVNAANAFLKYLEEPTERTMLILISENPGALPATIVSRCQKLRPALPDRTALIAWLQQQKTGYPEQQAAIVANLAQQAPLLALAYAEDDTVAQRDRCFADWLAVAEQRSHPVIIAESWQKLPAAMLIFWITSWLIDLVRHRCVAHPQQLYNPDLNKSLQALAERLELKSLYALYDLLLASRQRLDTTINRQCLFEEILIQWRQLNLRD